jgi:hypothetical protein
VQAGGHHPVVVLPGIHVHAAALSHTYIAVKQGRRKQSNFPTTTMVVVYLHLVEEVGLAVLAAEHLITG